MCELTLYFVLIWSAAHAAYLLFNDRSLAPLPELMLRFVADCWQYTAWAIMFTVSHCQHCHYKAHINCSCPEITQLQLITVVFHPDLPDGHSVVVWLNTATSFWLNHQFQHNIYILPTKCYKYKSIFRLWGFHFQSGIWSPSILFYQEGGKKDASKQMKGKDLNVKLTRRYRSLWFGAIGHSKKECNAERHITHRCRQNTWLGDHINHWWIQNTRQGDHMNYWWR